MQEEATSVRSDVALWALRFISGKYQGGEFPLRPNREIVIGRSSDLDMVLVEDMVSRKHAKILTDEMGVSIQDLGSTNGTFVNGEKIRKVELKDGDRILIGTSIIKLVALNGDNTNAAAMTETEARSKMQVNAQKRASAPKSMSGSIDEIPLPDLLQLLSTSRKSGVLVLRTEVGTGRIYLRKGQIYYTTMDERASEEPAPRKLMFRMLSWTTGFFELEPADEAPVPEEMQDSTEGLLMEGMRQMDEYGVLAAKLSMTAQLATAKPITGKLRELSPEELDLFQLALGGGTVQSLIDKSRAPDLDAAQAIKNLIDKGFLQTS